MALPKTSALKFDHSFILNLFIAVVAVTTLLLVCYLVILPSYETVVRGKDRARARGIPQRAHVHRQQILHQDQDEGKSVIDRIPDFKQNRLLRSVKKKHPKQKVRLSPVSPSLPPAGSIDVSAPPSLRPPPRPRDPASRPDPPASRPAPLASRPNKPPPRNNSLALPHPKHPTAPSPVPSTTPFIPISSIAEQHCQQEYCSEFLTSDDFSRWKECSHSAGINGTQTESQEGKCRFINQPHRDAVALVSFAGSGNTWVRGLLEAATGICTGAVYCDISLRGKGFAGEHTRGGQALVIKTHSSSSEWINARSKMRALGGKSGLFGSAILLVRNPFDALVAEWNRKVANNFRDRTTVLDSHTQAAGKEWFGRNTLWDSYVHLQMIRWQDVIKSWFLSNGQYPVLVVMYEALKNDAHAEVERMLHFLNVGFDSEMLGNTINTFQRKKHPKEFQHFTQQQIVYVNSLLKDISFLVSASEKSHQLDVEQYIHD